MAIDKVALTEKIHDELDLEIGNPCILFFQTMKRIPH